MKKIITLVTFSCLAATAISFAADNAALEAREKAAWQAFKDKKPDDFKQIVSADVVGLYGDGINRGIQGEVEGMKITEMKSFEISDYNVTAQGDDVVVGSYVVKIDATVDGEDASGTFNSATVWKKQGDNWMAIFHSNVKQQAK